jgi:hypothetical protein
VNSPLGQYAPRVAAVAAILVIVLWGAIQLLITLAPALGLDRVTEPPGLSPVAFIVIGAIFGSAVVANGHKEPLRAASVANRRLDLIGAPHVDPSPELRTAMASNVDPHPPSDGSHTHPHDG